VLAGYFPDQEIGTHPSARSVRCWRNAVTKPLITTPAMTPT